MFRWWEEQYYHMTLMPFDQLNSCLPRGKTWSWLARNFASQVSPISPAAVSASFILGNSGICIYKDHGRYVGEFDGTHIRNGYGVYYWPSGRKYEGEWKQGSMSGYGVETSSEGQYNGEWRDGLYHGRGVYTWISDGQIYGYILYYIFAFLFLILITILYLKKKRWSMGSRKNKWLGL